MSHKACEIVEMLNFLRPIDDPLYLDEIFDTNKKGLTTCETKNIKKEYYPLKDDAIDKIISKSKGYVSYVRSYNPYTFPERIDMGIVPKCINVKDDNQLKYTKLIRCPMEKFHYDTYKKYYKGVMPADMKHLMNIIFPDPNSKKEKYGIYKTKHIEKLRNANKKYFKKYNLDILNKNDKNEKVIITGNFLKKENIKKYSNKIYTILNNIEKSKGNIFIFLEDIKGIGIELFTEILKVNGYKEYLSTNKNDYKNFIVLAGTKEVQDRKKLIELYNLKENSDGSIIKIILGSNVTKESVTFKSLKEIHIVNYQYNLSTIEQIIGRGIRHCSHENIPIDERNVKIYKYVTSMPNIIDEIKYNNPKYSNIDIKNELIKTIKEDYKKNIDDRIFKNFHSSDSNKIKKFVKEIMLNPNMYYKESGEEKEYNDAEKQHILIRKIERGLKIGAVDCVLNRKSNIYEKEIEKYKNCEDKPNSKL